VNRLLRLFTPLAAALIVLAVACGGDSDDEPQGATSGAPSAGEASPPRAQAGRNTATGTLDMVNAAATLSAVESFRFELAFSLDLDAPADAAGSEATALLSALLGDIEAEGAYVAPGSYEVSVDMAGRQMQAVQIDDEAWANDGSKWVAIEAGFVGPFDLTSPAGIVFDLLPIAGLAGAETISERVNGVDATRFSFDEESLADLAESTGAVAGIADLNNIETMTLDVWLTADGVPVKLVLDLEAEDQDGGISLDAEFNITDLNDPDITIERPI
jgi:hypothetical protein